MRHAGESISQFAIRVAWETGHFWSPTNPEGQNVKQEDLALLKPDDPVVVAAIISMSRMEAARYTKHVLDQHGRQPQFGGEIGPAIESMVSEENGRCPVPDFAPPPGTSFLYEDPALQAVVERMQADAASPAFGSGNWKGCHQIGQFHCATVGVNTSGLPSFLQSVFLEVLKNVQRAYAGVGLLFRFLQNGKDMLTGEDIGANINTEMSFVNRSDGWIGLAIVGQGETCGSKIWCRFLSTYKGGSDTASIVTQWTTLIKHELGHNCGRGHTTGGVMNPSIVNNLPTEWAPSDPSTTWLKGQFGGVPVPIPGGGPTPKPDPPTTTEQLIRDLQVKNAVQDASINWLIAKVRALVIFFAVVYCQNAIAQVASSDGRSIVMSSQGPVKTDVIVESDGQKIRLEKTDEPSRFSFSAKSPSEPVIVERPKPRQWYLVSESWCANCPRAKAAFLSKGWSKKNILTISECQQRFGFRVPYVPYEFAEPVSSQATAVRMLGGSTSNASQKPAVSHMSPPVRFIQWPGWGQIDLETYNRNCNCSMCRSIRGKQQEYRRQLEAFRRSQTHVETVTPDQEGTPHALVETMLDSMGLRSGDVLGELGCGDGRVLIAAAKRGIRGIGVELDQSRAEVARRNVRSAGLSHLITIETGDALEFDLGRVTVATTYLYPPLLAKLADRLKFLRVVASPYHEIPGLPMIQIGDVWVYHGRLTGVNNVGA